jgi:DNA polymerase-3 subunit epsilon
MQRVLFLDCETTGLSVDDGAECIEVACIAYDVKLASPVSAYSSLMFATSNAAFGINGIHPDLLKHAPPAEMVWNRVYEFAKRCDAIVAHRAEFDRSFSPPEMQSLVWLCSKFDLSYPRCNTIGEHLINLCLQHGVGVVSAHRAMTDCDLLARLFTRVAELGVNLEEMFQRGLRPKKRFVADVSYQDKDLAKDRGFAWDAKRKQWYRTMPVEDAHDTEFPFVISQID